MTDLASRLALLPPDKRALFERLLRESGRSEDVFPLSVYQEGMWFLEQLQPHNPGYVGVSAVRIRGPLDPRILSEALNAVIRRHETMRTTFQLRDGRPVQVVEPWRPFDLPRIDLRAASPAAETLDRLILDTALGQPLRIEVEPPVRMALLQLADDESLLVAAAHHLISDRWSFGILLSELSVLYEALLSGRPSPLPDLPIQYGDFSAWQQQQRRDGRWEPHLAYWREHLAGAPTALHLPTDRPRPAVQSFQGDILPIELPESLMRDLGALANQNRATTYMALLAVFTVLLHRYSNQDDVVVGVPAAVRSRPEIEPLIGYFVNTLPIRTRLGGNPTFLDVLAEVRQASLAAYEHQEVPFDVIVADLRTPRDLSRPPVYQVSFTYGREPVPTLALGGAELTRVPVRGEGARFDLELQAFHMGAGLSGWLEYDRRLFERTTIERMAAHLRRLVEGVVVDPHRCIDDLDLIAADERRHILEDFNHTARRWPTGTGWIHERIESRALARPDAEAVRFEGRSLTYADLDRRANQLAHRLIRSGAGRDVLVGIGMHRSLDLVVALLAVLKAGAAYVPLDPTYPPARLEHMLRDAELAILLTTRPLRDRYPAGGAEVLCIDELSAELAEERPDSPDAPVTGEDLAYVIYTSGSTGTPKGVMNTHTGIRNRLLWMQDEFRLDARDRVLQKTPFSFDVSVWEFFWPLMAGATLVVARPEGHRDPDYLVETIRSERITTIHFVPSMLQQFLSEPVEECVSLRLVFSSGEALSRDLHDRFLSRSGAKLHNLYGPTEAAIDVTHWPCVPGLDDRAVPIGRPIANTQVYVLDSRLAPTPVGVPGQLFLGGDNLARGYLGRPELTAERFVRNPFDPTGATRLYATGDLARFRDDGVLDYLGRMDHQVKLRGFRIELGEIEAALTDHPDVRAAVVTVREVRPGDPRLAAYLTSDAAVAPAADVLTDHLRQRLPEYMVPAFVEVLDELPLTPSGKVDRDALPAPTLAGSGNGAGFVSPQDGIERVLAKLWRDVLGVDRVGRHDNFFDRGGHSLLMAELKGRIEAELGQQVSMVELFHYPTIASLAGFLGRAAADPEAGPAGAGQRAAHERAENRRRSMRRRRRAANSPDHTQPDELADGGSDVPAGI